MNYFRPVFGILMVIVYLSMAYMLVFTNIFADTLYKPLRIIFSVVFSVYGVFRGYRLWKDKK
ncbi:MAG: hypothetical protein LBS01_07910 [Prevotellaceae bacterium]|jgi:predicted membrane channel-forming protein YqfA (hemolysin III family)|nr:hypothetical protein [Prevotellaceae bacterium]